MPYTIRSMTRDEVATAVAWAAAEGWNPGLDDAAVFHDTDPGGFLVGLLDDEPVGCISAVRYDDAHAFLGFYIVRPEHRGSGYGLQLWNAAIAHVGERNSGLDGVPEQRANYERSGFVLAYRNLRYEGVAEAAPATPAGIVPLDTVPLETVLAYDTAHFQVAREAFLRSWLAMPRATALACVRDGELAGYGVIRECQAGYKIGPLFAAAEDLFASLSGSVPAGSVIYLDTPEVNAHAVALAQRHGMQEVMETSRMYNRGEPHYALAEVYGVTSFELG